MEKVKRPFPVIDVGLVWAKCVNIWGQLGFVIGAINTMMIIGVFYTTTVYPNVQVPFWAYSLAVVVGVIACIIFIVKYGISGYYRFFSNQSALKDVERKVNLILEAMNINDDTNVEK